MIIIIIYNTVTKKWILNETKYGITNTLRKNQQVIDDAIRAGTSLEIRSKKAIEELAEYEVFQGQKIKIATILRSHSLDGNITTNTIKTLWPK